MVEVVEIAKFLTITLGFFLLCRATYTDLKKRIIPNLLNMEIFILGIIYSMLNEFRIIEGISGAIGGFLIFLAIALITGGIGGGDVKLITALGMWTGIKGILTVIIYSFLISGIIGIVILSLKKGKAKSEMPMAPAIQLSVMIYILSEIVGKGVTT